MNNLLLRVKKYGQNTSLVPTVLGPFLQSLLSSRGGWSWKGGSPVTSTHNGSVPVKGFYHG